MSIVLGRVLVLILALQSGDTPANVTAAIDGISADSLRGHLSFLASDLLEGRRTPSRGLDVAALYIASQFRRSGLEPVGDDGYFQTATWSMRKRSGVGFRAELTHAEETVDLELGDLTVEMAPSDALVGVPVIKVEGDLADIPDDAIRDSAVVVAAPSSGDARDRRGGGVRRAAAAKGAKVILTIDRDGKPSGLGAGELVDPEDPTPRRRGGIAMMRLHGKDLAEWFEELPEGPTGWKLAVDPGEQIDEPIRIRNVAGLLRGSDPSLSRTHVIVSSHYDHLGTSSAPGDGDHIYNGANDDGSGTVSVIELASAFARLQPHPQRSILFITFFGEEMGLLGSRHYVKHPLLPLAEAIANVNLEQVGRTDDSEGPTSGIVMMTGVDYSQVADIMAAAGKTAGIEFRHHPTNSDRYFTASDNAAFALAGIPAHTICTAFMYPDYHGLGDHWEKIDYENMAKVDRAVAIGLWTLTSSERAPTWNESPKTERFVEAWRKLHP